MEKKMALALTIARDLCFSDDWEMMFSQPDYRQYVRGQAELICHLFGVDTENTEIIEDFISGKTDILPKEILKRPEYWSETEIQQIAYYIPPKSDS